MNRTRGMTLIPLIAAVAILGMGGFLTWFFYCPCERTSGGYLLGDEQLEPVQDWAFANDRSLVPLCQIQVNAGWLPHSINLNCMSSEGELFLSCSGCAGKRWSTAALANSEARLRAAGTVYPVTVERVTDDATLDRAWRARAAKMGGPLDTPRQDGWWSFRVVSR